MTTKQHSKNKALYRTLAALSGTIFIITMLANAQQPVLKITPLGTNLFTIGVTNAVATTNYTLFWTPALADENYPWQVLGVGNVGQSNFTVNGTDWNSLMFRVMIGTDSDGDGVPEWQDAQPGNPNVGVLSITIDSPTSGFNFN
jgi:hypothetical protein